MIKKILGANIAGDISGQPPKEEEQIKPIEKLRMRRHKKMNRKMPKNMFIPRKNSPFNANFNGRIIKTAYLYPKGTQNPQEYIQKKINEDITVQEQE